VGTASTQLDNPRLAEIKARNEAERRIFEAYLVAKRQ